MVGVDPTGTLRRLRMALGRHAESAHTARAAATAARERGDTSSARELDATASHHERSADRLSAITDRLARLG
jgi:hypothetical protein